jgi:hypothetical protein
MPASGDPAASQEPTVEASERVTKRVRDALLLLNHAVNTGFKSAAGQPIAPEVISNIETTAARLGVLEDVSAADGGGKAGGIPTSQWVAFELAYYDLAAALAPVTAETLRNTEGTSREPEKFAIAGTPSPPRRLEEIYQALFGYSPAQRFSRGLWIVALGFAVFVVVSEWRLQVIAYAADADVYRVSRTILELLVPWAYGGLGSCVYLLRSAHTYIYQRTFDLRRKPEYFNRILLGTICGGAIILFVNQLMGDDGTVIQLSSAALGFLAGYSTDFLFNTIERIIAAVLPKVGLETVKRDTSPLSPDFKDIADRFDKAKGADKDFYKALMEHATGARSPSSSRARPAGRTGKPGDDDGK